MEVTKQVFNSGKENTVASFGVLLRLLFLFGLFSRKVFRRPVSNHLTVRSWILS